jgi:predicted transcriptional regulator
MSIKLLQDVMKRAKTWPIEDLEKLARFADEIEADRLGPYEMSPEEEAAVNEGIAQADRGEFVSEEEMAAIFRRFGTK